MADLSIQGALASLPSTDPENTPDTTRLTARHSALPQLSATARQGVKVPKVLDKPVVIRLDAATREWLQKTAQEQDRAMSYIVVKLVEKAFAESQQSAQKEAQHG